MRRFVFALLAAVLAALSAASGAPAAASPPDFSKLDPAWAARDLDASFQSSEMGPAWSALKAVFPADYQQLMQDMAKAIIRNEDWSAKSGAFFQSHIANQIPTAQRAPARQQAEFQRQKADFLIYLSRTNTEACAYLGTLVGDPSILATLKGDQMKRYAALMATTVETIGAGRDMPVVHEAVTADDVAKIKAIMASQGASDEEIQKILSGQVGTTPTELCRAGVVKHNAVAAAPPEIVAKLAFR